MGRVETPGLGGAGLWATPIDSAHARAGVLIRSCLQVPKPDSESRWEAVGRGNGRYLRPRPLLHGGRASWRKPHPPSPGARTLPPGCFGVAEWKDPPPN